MPLKRKPTPRGRKYGYHRNVKAPKIIGDVAIVYSDKNKIPFLIDASDWEIVQNFRWHVQATGYPSTSPNSLPILLHHFLLGRAPDGLWWDHVNRNTLDNRRKNLRAVTPTENARNIRTRVGPRLSPEQRLAMLVKELKLLILKDF